MADFFARSGFVGRGPGESLRPMVTEGRITADGLTLSCRASAALLFDGKKVAALTKTDTKEVEITLLEALKSVPSSVETVR